YRSRANSDPRYPRFRAQVLAVERACQAKRNERPAILRTYAEDRIPEISIWAITELAETEPNAAGAFFRTLLPHASRLPVRSQIDLDRELSNVEGKKWQGSGERRGFLETLVMSKMSEQDALAVVARLDEVAEDDPEPGPTAVPGVLGRLLSNPTIP